MPMFVCDAMTQGEIGYLVQQALANSLVRRGASTQVATVVTQVLVDINDPAFADPTKPVGPFYSAEEAERLRRELGCAVREDAGRGWRRLVPSPAPLDIVELGVIKTMLENGIIVIAGGGGGIPVVAAPAGLEGVDAVVDKDRIAALMAMRLQAELLVILTAVPHVETGFGTPQAAPLLSLSLAQAQELLSAGAFAEGSMKPKIEAASLFVASAPSQQARAVITNAASLAEALQGRAGTVIIR